VSNLTFSIYSFVVAKDITLFEVNWIQLFAICVPALAGILWFSWRLHQSINRCKVPEEALLERRKQHSTNKLD